MGEQLDVGINDKLTGPADRMVRAADKLISSLDKLVEANHKLGESEEKAGHSHDSFIAKLHYGIEIASRAYEGFRTLLEKPLDLVFESAKFKENTLLALTAITGSEQKAQSLFKYSEKFAGFVPFETKDVASIQKRFITGGFNDKQAQVLMSAASDFGALTGTGAQGMEQFSFHIDQIRAMGKLDGRIMRELAMAGLQEDQIIAKIAKRMGTDIPTATAKVHAGTVDWQNATGAILDLLRDRGGGELGMLSDKMAHTVDGLYSTLKSRPFELFKDIDKTDGWKSLQGALQNAVDMLDPNSPTGAKLKGSIEGFFNDLFGSMFDDFSGPNGAQKMKGVLDGISETITKTGSVLQGLGEAASGFFGGLSAGLGVTGDLFDKDGKLSPETLGKIKDTFHEIGVAVAFVVDSMEKMAKAAGFVAGKVADNNLGAGSSKQFHRVPIGLGATLDIDTDNPWNSGLGILEGDTWSERLGAVNPFSGGRSTAATARVPATAGARGAPTLVANVTVHAQTGKDVDPETIARHVKDQVGASLTEHVEKLNRHQGGD